MESPLSKERHFMTHLDELVYQPCDGPFSASVELRGYTFRQRSNLRNSHRLSLAVKPGHSQPATTFVAALISIEPLARCLADWASMKKCEATSKTAAKATTKPAVANSAPSSIALPLQLLSANASQKAEFQ